MDRCFLSNICYFFPKALRYKKLFDLLIAFEPQFFYKRFLYQMSALLLPKAEIHIKKDLHQYSERDKGVIARHIPKKKGIFQRKKGTPEINSLFQGIFSIMLSLGMTLSRLSDNTIFTVISNIFLTFLLILVNVYFYYISKNHDK